MAGRSPWHTRDTCAHVSARAWEFCQVAHLREQLFPDVPPERFATFECGHVVPAESFLVLAVPRGPSGQRLNTEYHDRGNDAIVDDLVATVHALVDVIPAGVVCFLPSFAYLQRFVARAQTTAAWAALQARKKVDAACARG